jgi:hypothetical protein
MDDLFVRIEAFKLGSSKELAQKVERWIFCHHQCPMDGQNLASDDSHPTKRRGAMPWQSRVRHNWIPWNFHIA